MHPFKVIDKRIDEFSQERVSLDEISQFYSLEHVIVPEERPYTWSNTVESLNSVVSIGCGNKGVQFISLKNIENSKTGTDFRLLCSGLFIKILVYD